MRRLIIPGALMVLLMAHCIHRAIAGGNLHLTIFEINGEERQGQFLEVFIGFEMSVNCSATTSNSGHADINITCPGGAEVRTLTNNTASLVFTIQDGMDGMSCNCSYNYYTYLVWKGATFRLLTPNVTINGAGYPHLSNFYTGINDPFTVKCKGPVHGKIPDLVWIMKILCNSTLMASTSDGLNTVTYTTAMTAAMDGMQCSCTSTNQTEDFNAVSQFTLFLPARGPPAEIDVEFAPAPFAVCPSYIMNVTCSYGVDTVFPGVNMTLSGDFGDFLSPDDVINNGSNVLHVFQVLPSVGGEVIVTCVATNVRAPFRAGGSSGTAYGYEPPANSPTLTKSNGSTLASGSKYYVKEGDAFGVTCSLMGSLPTEMDMKFVCGGVENATSTGTQSVTLSGQVSRGMDGVLCICSIVHISGCYNQTAQFTFNVIAYGPSSVTPVLEGSSPNVEYCPDSDPHIFMYCEVSKADARPPPCVTLEYGVTPTVIDEPSNVNNTLADVIRYHFNFTVDRSSFPGTLNVKCIAVNPLSTSMTVEKTLDINMMETAILSPRLEMLDGTPIVNGTTVNARLGVNVTWGCSVEGGSFYDRNLTWYCGGNDEQVVRGGSTQFVYSNVQKHLDGTTCVCSGQHKTECYLDTSVLNIHVAYGPTAMTAGPAGFERFNLCPATSVVSFYCEVNKDDVNPHPNVTLQVGSDNGIAPIQIDQSISGVVRYKFQFTPDKVGIINANCKAVNPTFPDITLDKPIAFEIYEPPKSTQKLYAKKGGDSRNKMEDGQSLVVSLDETVEVTCKHAGGYPSYNDFFLTCGDVTNQTTQSTEASVTLTVARSTDQTVCQCRVTHESECYDQSTQFKLEVWDPTVITDFTINSQKETLEISVETRVKFVCEAEGLPTPNISITTLLSKTPLEGQMTSVNFYTKKFERTKNIACNESDTYVCTSDNGVSVQKSVTVLVTCPPETFRMNGVDQNQGLKVKRSLMGMFQVTFLVVSRPVPVKFTLHRIVKATTDQRAKRAAAATESDQEVDSGQFQTRFEEVDPRHGRLVLDVFDPYSDDNSQYRLDVSNGVGEDLQLMVETEQDTSGSSGGSGSGSTTDASKTVPVIAVGTVAAVLIILMVTVIAYFIVAARRESKGGKATTPPRQRVIVVDEDNSRPHGVPATRPSRVWRQQSF